MLLLGQAGSQAPCELSVTGPTCCCLAGCLSSASTWQPACALWPRCGLVAMKPHGLAVQCLTHAGARDQPSNPQIFSLFGPAASRTPCGQDGRPA